MGKVAIYARVSTIDKQDYNRQISDCMTAIGNKYEEKDIEKFAERLSGYTSTVNRPQLSKLLNIIENDANYFDKIYVTEISRLGRDPRETRNVIDNLIDKKIPIFITSIGRQTLENNGERDSIMSIVLQVLLEFADNESKTLKKRTKSGLLYSAKVKGNVGGGAYKPYGYTKDETKKLIIDNDEAIVIKEIFNYYKDGNGCKKISDFLNDKNTPTRTNKLFTNRIMKVGINRNSDDIIWSDKTINDIINNPLYKGERRYKGLTINAPPIITTELWDECNDLMKTKTHRNYLTTYTYLLKDLLVCGCCGRNYFAKYKPVPSGDKVYICSSRLLKGGNCGNVGVNISLIESVIYNEIVNSKQILDFLGSKEIKVELQAKIKTLNQELLINTKQISIIENKQQRLLNVFTSSSTMTVENYDSNNAILINDFKLTNDKIILIKKEISNNKIALSKQDNVKATQQMLIDAKNDRTLLASLYKQFIGKVVVERYDKKYSLIALYPCINGIEKQYPLRFVLDLSLLQKKPAQYSYQSYYIEPSIDEDIADYFERLNDIETIINTTIVKSINDNLILIESTYPIAR